MHQDACSAIKMLLLSLDVSQLFRQCWLVEILIVL